MDQLLQSLSLWRAVIDRLEKPGAQILDEIESIQAVTLVVALFENDSGADYRRSTQ